MSWISRGGLEGTSCVQHTAALVKGGSERLKVMSATRDVAREERQRRPAVKRSRIHQSPTLFPRKNLLKKEARLASDTDRDSKQEFQRSTKYLYIYSRSILHSSLTSAMAPTPRRGGGAERGQVPKPRQPCRPEGAAGPNIAKRDCRSVLLA